MIKEIIKEKLFKAIKKGYPSIDKLEFEVVDADTRFGDFATNAAMILTKLVGENPKAIAEKIKQEIEQDNIFNKVEIAGPGFINFTIDYKYWQEQIPTIIDADINYGRSDIFSDIRVNVEFISANPTGPLTLGNGRGGFSGDTLANILEALSAKVEREYYINDRGVQILALGHSVLKDAEAVYKGAYIDEIAPRINTKDPYEAGEQAAAILMEEYIKKSIEKMGIKFDKWFSEKTLYESGKIDEAMEYLQKTGLVYESEGALWLKTTKFKDDKDRVLVTKDGAYTYFASDIAYHFDKIQRGYHLLFDFWGADHHGYIGRMQSAIEILRQKTNWAGELKILIAQLVRLMSSGKEVRMSKRAGTYVTLDELIDEVGLDVTRFFFLERSLDSHMDFDLDLAKEKSQKNPVYYVQYAYARISSILAKIKNQKSKIIIDKKILSELKDPAEISLIKQIVKLPEIVQEIGSNYQIQKLPFYAVELARSFHNFYEKCPILSAEENVKEARLQLLKATQIVLKNTLVLMGISAPEKM